MGENTQKLSELSKDELMVELRSIMSRRRMAEARLLSFLVEVQRRAIHLLEACSSLQDFCVRRLGMSEDEAWRRANAARLVKDYPSALARIEQGSLHLTNLLLLKEHLTPANHEELFTAAQGRSKTDLLVLLAQRAPRPDVPESVTPDSSSSPSKTRLEQLAPERVRIEFTASTEFRDKLERVRELMAHSNRTEDLERIFGTALDLLTTALERKVLARADRPRAESKSSRRGHINRATRRAVFERDGWQCTYVDEQGRRCPAKKRLQLDHIVPRGKGGGDEATNLCVKCRAHNLLAATEAFGQEHVDRKIAEKRTRAGADPDP